MFVQDPIEPARRRSDAEVLAIERLAAALTDQARLGDEYERWAGTSAEQSAGVRLSAASLRVSRCDAAVKCFRPISVPAGTAPARARRRVTVALGGTLAFSVDGGRGAGGDARAEFAAHLGPRLDSELMALATLLLSELVNNCVVHGAAARPGTWIDVAISLFPHAIRVEVSDPGPAFRHVPRLPPADEGCGRGLYLVEQLASRWGVGERGRSRVWFELSRLRPED